MQEVIANWIRDNLLSFDSNIAKAVDALTYNFWDSSSAWYQFAQSVAEIIKPICLTIIVVCFLIDFLKTTIEMNILKWEFAMKSAAKFVLARFAMDVSLYIMDATYATVSNWTSRLGSSGTDIGQQMWGYIDPIIKDYSFLESLGVAITMGIMFIAIGLCSFLIQIIAYARRFELTIYMGVSPLPCAFLPLAEGGRTQITKNFFLSFAGICLQGMFMIMSIRLFAVLCNEEIMKFVSDSTPLYELAGQMLIAAVVLVMAVVKSSGWAKSIMGAA